MLVWLHCLREDRHIFKCHTMNCSAFTILLSSAVTIFDSLTLFNARYFPYHFMPEVVLITYHHAKTYLKILFNLKLQSQWSKGKHSWHCIWKPWVWIPLKPTFSLRKRKGTAGIWTQDLWFQSQLWLPLDHKLMKNAWKIKKILAIYFQIQNSLNFW